MVKFFPDTSPVHNLTPVFKNAILEAQDESFGSVFTSAGNYIRTVLEQLRIQIEVPALLDSEDPTEFSDKSFGEFVDFFTYLLNSEDYPTQAVQRTAASLAARAMLLRAFADPDSAVNFVRDKIITVVESFPQEASDIEVGRNRGDVLDPFILAATQYLLYKGEFDGAISATVSHKALMIIGNRPRNLTKA
ncbi:hypothetical protein [Leptolyngbya sp. KIOST-1]|uniref:hypothetical protein n=1 Tax=Leptolyngbya sp. KIOST-1 TaxID=1229172 RepID=UPI0012E02CBF|nr:hypothetical protein [Leptolyngbya sp. KIOST-1]